MLAVEPVLDDLALWVQLVNDRVRVAALMVREHADLAQLGRFEQELA